MHIYIYTVYIIIIFIYYNIIIYCVSRNVIKYPLYFGTIGYFSYAGLENYC